MTMVVIETDDLLILPLAHFSNLSNYQTQFNSIHIRNPASSRLGFIFQYAYMKYVSFSMLI